MKEKLIEDLRNQDLNDSEKEYIVAVVEYIDSNIQKIESDTINFKTAINRMLELVHSVNDCSTGVTIIDDIVNSRKQRAYNDLGQSATDYIEGTDYRTSNEKYGYIQNFIATISNYGGLFKYICETYRLELSKTKLPSKVSSR